MFVAMGKKSTRHRSNNSGEIVPYKSIQLKFSIDERITDGFYYASSLRMLNRIFQDPKQLLTPPEQIVVDDGVGRNRKDL
jgi:pyruvate/2-oxoglutarate dehydrogenase complex dihydrolipoamide acyltransferase (E2) component